MKLPPLKDTVMVSCKGVRYPFPAYWDGSRWKAKTSHLRTTGDDTAGIEEDYSNRDVITWWLIDKRA